MENKSGINIAGKTRDFRWVLLSLLAMFMTACSGHHISFKLDEYDFIDQELKKNIKSIVVVEFGKEPDVPLDIYFKDPNGVSVPPYVDGKMKPVEAQCDIRILTHHHEYYGQTEDSLQNQIKACCVLAGHICYIYPDDRYLEKTGRQRKISFSHDDNVVCDCLEDEVWLNMVNHNEVQIVQSFR